jgi:hypothetical protein
MQKCGWAILFADNIPYKKLFYQNDPKMNLKFYMYIWYNYLKPIIQIITNTHLNA